MRFINLIEKIFCTGAIIVSACTANEDIVTGKTIENLAVPENYFRINNSNFDEINRVITMAQESSDDPNIVFNSPGGITSTTLLLSSLFHNVGIVVTHECISNCAEILLPSANKVSFKNSPIVGFHGNILSYKHYINEIKPSDYQFCNWEYADRVETIFKEKNLNSSFWKNQMARLVPTVEFIHRDNSCPFRVYNFKNHVWLPTSFQLRNDFGLHFSGEVCADNLETCSLKIDSRWPKSTRIIVGNKLYISKGL